MSSYKTILSLDGGGIRGIITAQILHVIEENAKRPIHELFDLIVGTSTGGILAAGLTSPNKTQSAKQLLDLYVKQGRDIFSRSPWKYVESLGGISDERYDVKHLEDILSKMLGNDELKNTHCDIVITSYDIEKRKPYLFKTSKAKIHDKRNHLLRHVARATSAAPTYFEPLLLEERQGNAPQKRRVLVDGGVFASNPSMIGVSEALASGAELDELLVCSIGTGTNNRPILYDEAKDWGMVGWVVPVLSVMLDGMSDSSDYHVRKLLSETDESARYLRLDGKLKEASDDIDEASRGNIRNLLRTAREIIEEHDEKLDTFVQKLLERARQTDKQQAAVAAKKSVSE